MLEETLPLRNISNPRKEWKNVGLEQLDHQVQHAMSRYLALQVALQNVSHAMLSSPQSIPKIS